MTSLDDWLDALSRHLGVELPPELVAPVLDLARDAAHNVLRPAAPLSTFVAGYAAALAAGSPDDQDARRVRDARILATVERARQFAEAWDGTTEAVDSRGIRVVDSSTLGGRDRSSPPSL